MKQISIKGVDRVTNRNYNDCNETKGGENYAIMAQDV